MAATWTTQGERGHPATIRVFTWIALTLGRPIARLLLYPIVTYFVFAGGAARAASRDYLKRVLGREPNLLDGFRHVHCFASVVLDRLYLLNDRHDLFRIDVHGTDLMRRVMAGSQADEGQRHTRGAIVIGSHIGSFEAVRAGGREQKDLRVSMVMYEDNAQYLSQVFAAINPRLAESIIPLGRVDSMLRVKRALDDGDLIGLLADRMLAEESGSSMREVMLFDSPVPIPTGPFRMAAMLRRPVIFIVGLYRGGNRYEVHYEELFDFSSIDRHAPVNAAIDAAIDRYAARLEHYCKAAPYNWFNFYDYWNDTARAGTYQSGRRDTSAS